jgi:hypothetical protein
MSEEPCICVTPDDLAALRRIYEQITFVMDTDNLPDDAFGADVRRLAALIGDDGNG